MLVRACVRVRAPALVRAPGPAHLRVRPCVRVRIMRALVEEK